jgi:hypothetical protein
MQSALELFPFLILLGFAVVGVFMATMLIMWLAVWRAVRRGDAASKPPAPKPARSAPRLSGRRRLLVLALVGGAGGALVGAALSALAVVQAARSRRPGGRVGASGGL